MEKTSLKYSFVLREGASQNGASHKMYRTDLLAVLKKQVARTKSDKFITQNSLAPNTDHLRSSRTGKEACVQR